MGVLEPSNVWPPIGTFKSELMLEFYPSYRIFRQSKQYYWRRI
jgi:hypothetical protein